MLTTSLHPVVGDDWILCVITNLILNLIYCINVGFILIHPDYIKLENIINIYSNYTIQDFFRHEDFYLGWVERKCRGLIKSRAQTNSSSIASSRSENGLSARKQICQTN